MSFNYSPRIQTSKLMIYMDAGNTKSYLGTGSSWIDLGKTQSNNSTLINGTTFDSSDNGSIVFDGVNDYVRSDVGVPLTGTVTYNFWVKSTGNASNQSILSSGYQGNAGFVWIYRNANSNSISMQYSNGTTFVATSTTGMFTNFNSLWLNICVVVDYTGGTIRWYKNGALHSGPTSITTPVAPTPAFFRYIGSYNTLIHFFNGNISIVQIYDKLLSDVEVAQNYNALKARYI